MPRSIAFKQLNLSIWHIDTLSGLGGTLEQLQFGSLQGSGRAEFKIADIQEAAKKATQKQAPSGKLTAKPYFSPNTVDADRLQWKDAHMEVDVSVQAETKEQQSKLNSEFRMALCAIAKCTPPAKFRESGL